MFITQSHFPIPKDVRLNSTYYLIMKTNNKRELQNIAIDHSADIDYKVFIKIYRECTKKLHFFDNWYNIASKWSLNISKKIYFILIKMALTDQIKILDRKIK